MRAALALTAWLALVLACGLAACAAAPTPRRDGPPIGAAWPQADEQCAAQGGLWCGGR